MEKQPARAAPMSSSGLLADCPSKREPSEKGTSAAWAGFMLPFPVLRLPLHCALALLPMVYLRKGIVVLRAHRAATPRRLQARCARRLPRRDIEASPAEVP